MNSDLEERETEFSDLSVTTHSPIIARQAQDHVQHRTGAKSLGVGVVVIASEQPEALRLVLTELSFQLRCGDRLCVVIATESDTETYTAACEIATSCFRGGSANVSVQFATHGIRGFNAGANRDQGTSYILGESGSETLSGIIYLDGDCVPGPETIAGFRNLFDLAGSLPVPVPVLGNGIRTHSTTGRIDSRLNNLVHGRNVFSVGMDRVILHDRDIRGHRVCWSCLCGLNIEGIKTARRLNHEMFGDVNRVFASRWDTRYGAEDTYLGLQIFRAQGIVVAMNPETVYATHQDHPTRANTDEAIPNTRSLPEADAALIRHLQCQNPVYVTLHTTAYQSMNRMRNGQVRDNSEFYDSILSVHVGSQLVMERASLVALGYVTDMTSIPLLNQLASFIIGRVVTYTFGSGATLSSRAHPDGLRIADQARVVWNQLRLACIDYQTFIDAVSEQLASRTKSFIRARY